MKKNGFSNSFRILTVMLLAIAVFVPKRYSQPVMAVFMAGWLIVVLGGFLVRKVKESRHLGRKRKLFKEKSRIRKTEPVTRDFVVPTLPKTEELYQDADTSLMMQHISLRISEKLKSAYPNAIWKWNNKPSLHEILNGKTFRISLEGMGNFTHADITFDKFGRIHIVPMQVGSFGSDKEEQTDNEDKPKAPPVVDVRAWYELIGQCELEKQITELNANGHSRLTIKENGDIVINKQKKEVLLTSLHSFPGKNYWNELVSVLEENDLTAKIAGNLLQVSWIM